MSVAKIPRKGTALCILSHRVVLRAVLAPTGAVYDVGFLARGVDTFGPEIYHARAYLRFFSDFCGKWCGGWIRTSWTLEGSAEGLNWIGGMLDLRF